MSKDNGNCTPKPIAFVRSGKITLVLNEAFSKLLADHLSGADDDALFQLSQRINEQLEFFDRQRRRFGHHIGLQTGTTE